MPARNEGAKLQASLRALACHTDGIIYLDDCSTDNSVELVEACREECRIERILRNDTWKRDEPADRNRLLQAGREIGGTHFIVIDADEVLTSNLLVGDYLRKEILKLSPAQSLSLPWIHLWGNAETYRVDGILGVDNYKNCIFCDDGRGQYKSDFIHTPRVPKMRYREKERWALPYGLLHFQSANLENLKLKQKWYQWLERKEKPERDVAQIRSTYAHLADETELVTEKINESWLHFYPDFDSASFTLPDQWRLDQMKGWEREKGAEYFSGLV